MSSECCKMLREAEKSRLVVGVSDCVYLRELVCVLCAKLILINEFMSIYNP